MNTKKLFSFTSIALLIVIGIAHFIVNSHLVGRMDTKKLFVLTTIALLTVNVIAYFIVSSHRINKMNTKKLFGFTSIALLSVIGLVFFIVDSHRIDLEPLYLSKFTEELKNKGYTIGTISYHPKNKEIIVQLSKNEPNLYNAKKDIKNLIKNELNDDNLMDVTVHLEITDLEER